jgi:hypothetical protein
MEPCTVETGLLRKSPCGQPSLAACANCERPLCGKHAVAQLGAGGKKTGTFLCPDCDAAFRQYDKSMVAVARNAGSAAAAQAAKQAAEKPKAAVAPPAAAAAPAKPAESSDGGIDFTPSKE